VVIYTRTPNRFAVWPGASKWRNPSDWGELRPAGARWETGVEVDAEALKAADAADARRAQAWIEFLKGSNVPVDPLQPADAVREHMQALVFGPLARVLEHRPDLAVPVNCLRGDIHLRLGDWKAAREALAAAREAAPGWREASYGLHVKMARRPPGAPGGPTDYAAAQSRLQESASALGADASVFELDGLALRKALLAYYRGEFEEAPRVLDDLAQRYPHDAFLRNFAGFARKAKSRAAQEAQRRKRPSDGKLPRAVLKTTRGTVVLELFQDDAPNSVSNFVFLGRSGYYDGVAIHRTVPFFVVQTGDGLSRSKKPEELARVGTGTPGYAIRSEPNDRALLRGTVAMANAGKNTEGSQFFITTGTAVHLEGDQTVIGRVLSGQDVVEALTEEDRIESVTFDQLDPERRYHPTDASGRAAPAPR
jgi:peptidyl-prolyl cis-trans isomerase B (cyclophilin B)